MFYKVINNNMVVDLLQKIRYVRYLPKSKRWITTEAQSAHGFIGSDGNTIYLLEGRNCAYEEKLLQARLESVSEEEYSRLANEIALQQKEKAELNARIDALEATLAQQTSLLEQLLAKLS